MTGTKKKSQVQSILSFDSDKPHTCPVCEMTYNVSIPSEKQAHTKYHSSFVNGIPWTTALPSLDSFTLIVKSVKSGRSNTIVRGNIVTIDKTNKSQVSKVDQLLDMVNQELSASQDSGEWKSLKHESSKAFVIVIENRAVGVCSTDTVGDSLGRWMIHSSQTIVPNQINKSIKIGISRIWIAPKWRRYGLGQRFLQVVLKNSIYGVTLTKQQIAFSQPSTSGGLLAKSFNGVSHKSGEILIPVYIE
ncbi:uncharacterized protein SPAPADRAFT_131666 [Spathaspora passalidarum NRRL Y-27907]|uniref:N-acetyltransferase ECO1 n=1 Tax=Spathaspora passalidarum (strain NRRL Y-27907 / 11-Y1) TaxID=619300 RepID=G3AG40_SPAPN|nr:uncharacterized protein SPAPADRAFT_131666 [Spathaspora passalidarum NRRL Y-27907]EGW35179.1 hypothetical protein SPAPADRAFT_131666 [Spathaspora passalidarum NRRL Y-27907]